jgi:hypothetical protein
MAHGRHEYPPPGLPRPSLHSPVASHLVRVAAGGWEVRLVVDY